MIRVQPGARAARLLGWGDDGALRMSVREPAKEGRANQAVVALLAASLGVSRSRVRLSRGAASRLKRVEIEGCPQEELERRVAAALAAAERAER